MPRIPTPYEEQIRDSAYRQGLRDGRNNMRDAFTRDLARDLLLAEVRRNGIYFHDLGEAGKLAFHHGGRIHPQHGGQARRQGS